MFVLSINKYIYIYALPHFPLKISFFVIIYKKKKTIFFIAITHFCRIKSTRRELNGYDEQLPMSASASQSDGVFLISEPLIGDMDKSNKYTVPIFAD